MQVSSKQYVAIMFVMPKVPVSSLLSFVIQQYNTYILLFHKVKPRHFVVNIIVFENLYTLLSILHFIHSFLLFLLILLYVEEFRQTITVCIPPGIWKIMMAPLYTTPLHARSSDRRLWTSKSWQCEWSLSRGQHL